jgi:1,4-dihydroxy-2-naphthoate polyprenyltransferase
MRTSRSAAPTSHGSPGGPRAVNPWIEGARVRTLGAAVSPVLVGTAAAKTQGSIIVWRAAAALVVAVALQVGANYANDYSDGIRGTDSPARKGPTRLVAMGIKSPRAVRNAAVLSFLVAALAGLALAVAVDLRLLLVGISCIAAAALYTGGPRPYGYHGWGEASVLLFFGLVATCGSAYVQQRRVPALALVGSFAVGLLSCCMLLANNVRDEETDRVAGKRTLAVRLGGTVARRLYGASLIGSFGGVLVMGALRPRALLGLIALPLAISPFRDVVIEARAGRDLVPALLATARLQLAQAALVGGGLWLS